MKKRKLNICKSNVKMKVFPTQKESSSNESDISIQSLPEFTTDQNLSVILFL